MAANPSKSLAGRDYGPPRERLLSIWQLAGLGAAVTVALVLIFPQERLLQQATRGRTADALTVSYLANLLRTDPGNVELRLKLAEKKIEIGDLAEAQRLLSPVFRQGSEPDRRRARLTELRILEQQFHALPENSTAREERRAKLLEEFRFLGRQDWDRDTLVALAGKAAAFGDTRTAADVYKRMVSRGMNVDPESFEETAKAALGTGDYRLAASLHFAAQARARDSAGRRAAFLAGVRTLQSGNLLREALAAADEHRGDLADDELLRFLVRLAQSANDLPRAERYVRELLQMSGTPRRHALARDLAGILIGSAHAAEALPGRGAAPAMRPYDEESYTLAYQIFLANGNLADAQRVAEAAVRQNPDHRGWRERLAQVAEWNRQPASALREWLAIARSTGSQDAWNAVLRLAPGLFDDSALIAAWAHAARARVLSDAEWQLVVDTYERAGKPDEAIALLDAALARQPRRLLREARARLLDRTGRLAAAIDAYRALVAEDLAEPASEASITRALRLATLLFTRSDFRGAFDVLDRHRARAGPANAAYWTVFAELAWHLDRDEAAREAYTRLAAIGTPELTTLQRLVTLLRTSQPEESARIAEGLFAKTGRTDFLLTALDIHAARGDLVAQRRLFAGVSPAAEATLARDAFFVGMRARFHQATGNADAALADVRALARLDPTVDNRSAVFWQLIDLRRTAELRKELAGLDRAARDDPALYEVLAAVHLTLGDAVAAIPYFARQAPRRTDDYLFLLNYADALENGGEPGMGERVRRHAWTVVRRALASAPPAGPDPALLQAHARLALAFSSGDETLALMRYLVRQDGATPGQGDGAAPGASAIDASVRELVLSWTLSTGQFEAARAWMWRNYARKLARPRWAELSLALVDNDVDTIERMLAMAPEELPRHDRVEAARRLQRIRFAQTLAFEALEALPSDDTLHLQLTDAALQTAGVVGPRITRFDRGVLTGREHGMHAAVWVTPRLRLAVDLLSIDQESRDRAVIANVPGRDRTWALRLTRRHDNAETDVAVFQRLGLTDLIGVRASHTRQFGNRISATVGVGYNDRAIETTALRVGGVKDQVDASVYYGLAKREYLRGQVFAARYRTQDRSVIGSGRGFSWETGYRIRTEYPDWTVRLAGSVQRYAHSGSGDARTAQLDPTGAIPGAGFFLPQDFGVAGVYAGFGQFFRDNYTQAWRPFAEAGLTHNTVSGDGYLMSFGVAGSVAGHDHLAFHYYQAKGGGGSGDLLREIGFTYRYFFDRF
jgi:predicted Zn-dependent protease